MIFRDLELKKKKIAVVGLGYVGLPLALEFAKRFSVVGFDINEDRIEMMKNGVDPSNELESEAFENKDIVFTADIEVLKGAHFYIVAVPTPVDINKTPNLTPVLGASDTIGKVLKKGDYVVYESTVYPGCTEEDCLPILEKNSGLKLGDDFKLGYSPERINPGDKEHTVANILKIVSGSDDEALSEISKTYGAIITAGIYEAKTIKVAEAAKVIENTQRDLNISFMNELSIIFDKMGINTKDVIDAAGTKWNFIKLYPGLVGGHCISVDPYYLLFKSRKLGYDPQVILSGRRINDEMPMYIASRLAKKLVENGKTLRDSKVLMMGITFKENVSDIRNSKVADLIKELEQFSIKVEVADPYAENEEVLKEYGISLIDTIGTGYDAVVVAVNHNEYRNYNEDQFIEVMNQNPILFDIKGIYNDQFKNIDYWNL